MKVISYYCYKVLKLKKNSKLPIKIQIVIDSFKFFELQNSNVTLYLKEYKYITLLGLTPSKTYDNEENLQFVDSCIRFVRSFSEINTKSIQFLDIMSEMTF